MIWLLYLIGSALIGGSGWAIVAYQYFQHKDEQRREISRLFKVADIHEEVTKVGLTPSSPGRPIVQHLPIVLK